eukprot:CAMPEP_0183340888 /NCGR_PEP_ID=MMETSP0164_2-20130417/7288_1 /TAXON_ID=221442 /ORGANISM="Coccolithus pelagicus ssp braarudi, Strain PLY182g" /LENGTH=91 /DNA_ID=CAMNT_0025511093 /DNA_START=813 /DNA_END=1089 /DNA_ORIENTATION=-
MAEGGHQRVQGGDTSNEDPALATLGQGGEGVPTDERQTIALTGTSSICRSVAAVAVVDIGLLHVSTVRRLSMHMLATSAQKEATGAIMMPQ